MNTAIVGVRSIDAHMRYVIDATSSKRRPRENRLRGIKMGLVKELYLEMKERGLSLTLKQYMEMKENEKDNDNRRRWNR